LGFIQELKEDQTGLYFRSKMGGHTEGQDFLKMYQEGIIREHSIGFNYIADKIKQTTERDEEGREYSVWDISEVKLWEGSAVVFGANSETPNLSIVKSQEDINKHLEEINERMEVFIKALTDDKLSQKYNNLFTLELMQLKHQYNSLLNLEEPLKNTLQDQEPSEEEKRKAEEKEIRTKLNLL